jgi:hypothetical protein
VPAGRALLRLLGLLLVLSLVQASFVPLLRVGCGCCAVSCAVVARRAGG